jgi:hypothetical protein
MPKFIAKCSPSLGDVSIWWSRCCQSIIWPMARGRAIFYLRDKVGGEIAEVRNGIVDAVLEYDKTTNPVTHLFWVDDDVLVFPGCLLELLHQDTDICSGVYFTKMPGNLSEPLIFPYDDDNRNTFEPDQVYDVLGHGMGLTLVRTEVYKRMRDELNLSKDKYGRPEWYHTTKFEEDVTQDESGMIGLGCTEDTYFCRNAIKLGYSPRIVTSKMAFGFHYDRQNDKGYPERQWNQWINCQPIEWNLPGGKKVIWD